MTVTTTRTLPAQFIEDLGKDYAKQLTATTAIPVDTSKFAPQVAAQDALQTPAPNTCLLYTSPSPRDGLLSRMPSSA